MPPPGRGGGVLFRLAGAVAVRALPTDTRGSAVDTPDPLLEEAPYAAQRSEGDDGDQMRAHVLSIGGRLRLTTSYAPLNSPANPMNASDRMPAMIRFIAVPFTTPGILDSSAS